MQVVVIIPYLSIKTDFIVFRFYSTEKFATRGFVSSMKTYIYLQNLSDDFEFS